MGFLTKMTTYNINSDERNKRLLVLLAEAKARGIPIPKDVEYMGIQQNNEWNTDENGYFISRTGRHFNPREELVDFITSRARYILLRSGRGGGKSTAGIQKALLKMKQGLNGAVLAPDFEQFRQSTWQELREWIPWNMVVPKQRYRESNSWEAVRPFTMVFKNGAKMICKGLKDPESARGSNINWLMYDEGRRDVTGLGWKNAIAAVRVGDNPQAWCTTTPADSQHWTSKFFDGKLTDDILKVLEDANVDPAKQDLFHIVQTSIDRNKDNVDPMFYASILAAYPAGYLRAREVEGRVADDTESLGSRLWFEEKGLGGVPDWVHTQVRFWDLAATENKMLSSGKKNDPDETVGSLVGTNEMKDKFVIEDQVGGTWAWHTIKQMILETAKRDGQEVKVCFEQEPASGGKNQVAELINLIRTELPGWDAAGLEARKLGDRVLAANVWFGEAMQGQWYYVKGLWNEKFFSQLDYFPNEAIHDDRITSVTGARHKIAPINKWKKIQFLAIGGNGSSNEEKENSEPLPSTRRFSVVGFGSRLVPSRRPFSR